MQMLVNLLESDAVQACDSVQLPLNGYTSMHRDIMQPADVKSNRDLSAAAWRLNAYCCGFAADGADRGATTRPKRRTYKQSDGKEHLGTALGSPTVPVPS